MANNDFLIFDEEADNMLSQALYSADTDRVEGFKTGLARSIVTNKVLYQVSKLCHTFGEILKDNDYNASDSMTVEELKTAIINTFTSASVLELCYPVGSIYFSVNNVSPATLFGFGTWVQIKDRFLLACGDIYSNGSTGGASTVAITTAQMPSHNHGASSSYYNAHNHGGNSLKVTGNFNTDVSGASGVFSDSSTTHASASGQDNTAYKISLNTSGKWSGKTSDAGGHSHTITINNNGSGQAHNNMPPYLAVYVWKRTA